MIDWVLVEWIITIVLLIVVGIPFMIAFVIPMTIYALGKKSWFPTLEDLIIYFNVDITKKPYSDWLDKHPIIYFSLTSLELYTAYFLIKTIKGLKSIWRRLIGKSS